MFVEKAQSLYGLLLWDQATYGYNLQENNHTDHP